MNRERDPWSGLRDSNPSPSAWEAILLVTYAHTAHRTYDGNGNMLTYTNRRGFTTSYVYDADDRLVQVIDALGGTTTYTYDNLGQIVNIENTLGDATGSSFDADGRNTGNANELAVDGLPTHRVKMEYDAMGRVTKRVFEDGSFELFTYDNNGNIITVTNERGYVTAYTYDKNDRLLTETDPMMGVTATTYTPTGMVATLTDAEGGVTAYTYDENDNIATVTDAEGYVTTYAYDKKNRVVSIIDNNGSETRYGYDANGNLTDIYNPDGGHEVYTYDLNDQKTSFTDGEGFTTLYVYDENGNTVEVKDPRGNSFRTEYDELDRPVKTTNEEGGVVEFVYDAMGGIVQATNEDSAVTKYTYDAKGRVVAIEDAYGNFKRFEYDPRDRVTSETDENGITRFFTYDARGNVIMWTDGLENSEKYRYDANDNMVKKIDRNGGVYTYTYDLLNRVTSETDPLGNTKHFTYNKNSQIVAVTDENGNKTEYVLDGNGNIVETIDATGHSSFFEYDSMNRLVKISLRRIDTLHGVDEMQETLFFYDYRGLQVREVNALGDEKFAVYDGNGNLVQTLDEDGYITEFEHSPVNLVSAINYADGKASTFLYNGTGELVEFTDWNGKTSITRDLLNRILAVNDHNNRETRYGYDNVGNVTAIGYPEGGQVDYYYDAENQIVQMLDVVEGVYDFSYDPNGNITSKEYPNNEFAYYYYDANDRPIQTEEYLLGGKKVIVSQYTWDAVGNMLEELQYNHGQSGQGNTAKQNTGAGSGSGSGSSHRGEWRVPPPMTVNEDGTVLNPSGHAPPGLQRSGDTGKDENGRNNGRPDKALTVTGKPNKGEHIYTYDALNQMVSSTIAGTISNFTYDTVGNLISEQVKNQTTDYQYNSMNQLVRMQTNNDTSQYSYDRRGNRVLEETKNKTRTYSFDATNHLVDGTNVQNDHSYYTYNALFMRVNNTQVTHSGNVYSRDYVVDYNSLENNDIMVFADGEYIQQHVYRQNADGHSERLFQLTDTTPGQNGNGGQERKLYVHEDVQGNTRYFTKTNGQSFAELEYDAWGFPASPNKLVNNDHGNFVFATYTGHPYDTIVDMYFAEARFYDAANRTWISRDPAKDGLNWYVYVGNNPTSMWDPTGLRYFRSVSGSANDMNYFIYDEIITDYSSASLTSEDFNLVIAWNMRMTLGQPVTTLPVNKDANFITQWNQIGNDVRNVNMVVINSHGVPIDKNNDGLADDRAISFYEYNADGSKHLERESKSQPWYHSSITYDGEWWTKNSGKENESKYPQTITANGILLTGCGAGADGQSIAQAMYETNDVGAVLAGVGVSYTDMSSWIFGLSNATRYEKHDRQYYEDEGFNMWSNIGQPERLPETEYLTPEMLELLQDYSTRKPVGLSEMMDAMAGIMAEVAERMAMTSGMLQEMPQ